MNIRDGLYDVPAPVRWSRAARWIGKPLPDALVKRLIASRHFTEGPLWARQLFLALLDFRYHTGGEKVDTTRIYAEL